MFVAAAPSGATVESGYRGPASLRVETKTQGVQEECAHRLVWPKSKKLGDLRVSRHRAGYDPGVSSSPELLPRALGRVAAHEIGHHFFGSKHAHSGLMKRELSGYDLISPTAKDLHLTREQLEGMHAFCSGGFPRRVNGRNPGRRIRWSNRVLVRLGGQSSMNREFTRIHEDAESSCQPSFYRSGKRDFFRARFRSPARARWVPIENPLHSYMSQT